MKTMIFSIENTPPTLEKLKRTLQKQGYQVLDARSDYQGPIEEALIVTDSNAAVKYASEEHMACIGFEDASKGEETQRLKGVPIVLLDFEGIDAVFLEQMYRRCRSIPWEIAEEGELLIRESVPEDFKALYAIYQQPGIDAYMPGMGQGEETEKKIFEAYMKQHYPFFGYGMWTVIEKSTGHIVGRAGIENGEYRGRTVLSAGYLIGQPWQGRGYGAKALLAVLNYADENLLAEEIYAFIRPGNQASVRTALKAGFYKIEKGVYLRTFRR